MNSLIGSTPRFFIVGDACRVHLAYVEPVVSHTLYPVATQIAYDDKPANALRVMHMLEAFSADVRMVTDTNIVETLFVDSSNGQIILHIKPDPNFGFISDYRHLRISKNHNPLVGEIFRPSSYSRYAHENPFYIFYDNSEGIFNDEEIPKLIALAPGPVYVCTRRRNLSLYEGAAAVVISENDFKASKNLVSNLVVTLGKDGASFNDKVYSSEPVYSGDSMSCREDFFSAFCYTHVMTKDIELSIKIANKTALYTARERGIPKIDTKFREYIKQLKREISERKS